MSPTWRAATISTAERATGGSTATATATPCYGASEAFSTGCSLRQISILYTSDHGQSFHERGDGGEATHCTPAPQIEEGIVPLVVIGDGGDEGQNARWAQAAAAGRDQSSHYRIFPTLLGLMGYAAKDVAPLYGPDLLAAEPDPFTFNTRFNARLGSDPAWLHVPLDQIARPPLSDYRAGATTGTK